MIPFERRHGFAFGFAVSTVYALGMWELVGWVGLSRAVSVDPLLLVQESAAGLVGSCALALLVAAAITWWWRPTARQAVAWLAWLFAAALAQAFLAIASIGELGLRDLPISLVVVTGLGTQLVAAAVGIGLGASLTRSLR